MFGDWVQQLHVQLGVVLRQRLVSIVVDELDDGAEGQRVREPVLPIPVEYLNELVVSPFPVARREEKRRVVEKVTPKTEEIKVGVRKRSKAHLRVRV